MTLQGLVITFIEIRTDHSKGAQLFRYECALKSITNESLLSNQINQSIVVGMGEKCFCDKTCNK